MNLASIKNSTTFRVLFIGFLILLLLNPMGMVESVIFDRSHLYRQATNEITHSWGKEQLLVGPILTLPFVKTFSESGGWSYDSRYQHLRPETMTVDSHIETQIRYRGIYEVPVYLATVRFNGLFSLAEVGGKDDSAAGLQLDEGEIHTSLLHIDPGGSVPEHTHNGFELTLLLAGSFTDEQGEYVAGDFIMLDKRHQHHPVSEHGCLCYTVANDSLHFTQGINKLLNPIGSFIY